MKKQSTSKAILRTAFFMLALGAAAPTVMAHVGAAHDKPKAAGPVSTEQKTFGKQGDPEKINRTITIDMHDTMRFGPADITAKQGETIKFVVKNEGKVMHEMVLGTLDELKEHGEMMKKHPGMEHDEPYMAHVSPGGKTEMVWHFTKAGEFHYACLIPGHFEAGMVGKITVAATN